MQLITLSLVADWLWIVCSRSLTAFVSNCRCWSIILDMLCGRCWGCLHDWLNSLSRLNMCTALSFISMHLALRRLFLSLIIHTNILLSIDTAVILQSLTGCDHLPVVPSLLHHSVSSYWSVVDDKHTCNTSALQIKGNHYGWGTWQSWYHLSWKLQDNKFIGFKYFY